MSNLAVRTETKEYKRGDKGVYGSDMNYLLSQASNSANFIAQNAIRLDADIDKTWKIEKNGSGGVLIRLGFIWRNGNFCRMTDNYTGNLSDKVNDELNYVHIFQTNTPKNKPAAEGTIPHGGLTSSSSIWYVAALSSDAGTTNIDEFDDWLNATHTTTQSILPNRYHILKVYRDELQYLYSGLNTHVDSCLYPIGCANFTGAGEGITSKLINISNTFLKQSINDKREMFPWDLMHYDRTDGTLYINVGDVIVDSTRYTHLDWADLSDLFPYNRCATVVLENGTNYVYLESDFSSVVPVFQFKTTDDIDDIVNEPGTYRTLLYTMLVSVTDYYRVSKYARNAGTGDMTMGDDGSGGLLPFTFRVIDVDGTDTLQVYLLDRYSPNVYYNESSILQDDAVYADTDVGPKWRTIGSGAGRNTLPTAGNTVAITFYIKPNSGSSLDWSSSVDMRWDLYNSGGSGPDPALDTQNYPRQLCRISNVNGSYVIRHQRKGQIWLDTIQADTDSFAKLGLDAAYQQRSISKTIGTNQGSYQLYNFTEGTSPSVDFEDMSFVVREQVAGTPPQVAYLSWDSLVDEITGDIPSCTECFDSSFWTWFCEELATEYSDPEDAPWACLFDLIGERVIHSTLSDITGGTAGDDHCDATRDGEGTNGHGTNVSYLNLDGGALRNSFSENAVIGDKDGVKSIHPTERTLDGESDANNVGWKITSTADVNYGAGTAKGALVVAGGITTAGTIMANNAVVKTAIYCSGTAEASDATPSFGTDGGIYAAKKIKTATNYMVGAVDGITDQFTWLDNDGNRHGLVITGGIITERSFTPA